MIKYKLCCKKCKLLFDSWFASSLEYEKLKKKNFLNCHNCGSEKVEKTLMAPNLINKKIDEKIREYQKFIRKNFEYVGENFAYEARSIQYKNKKKNKGIYGIASKKELKDLSDEGIKTQLIPWLEDKKN